MRPSRTITAPNGPPALLTTFSVASAMARRKNSGFADGCIADLLQGSLEGK
jgi:hypothetical protein